MTQHHFNARERALSAGSVEELRRGTLKKLPFVCPSPSDPRYDQWLRVRPKTGSAALVKLIVDATADVRSRTKFDDKPQRKLKADARLAHETIAQALVATLVCRHLTKPGGWTRIPLAHPRYRVVANGRPERRKSTLHRPGGGRSPGGKYFSSAVSQKLSRVAKALAGRGFVELHVGDATLKERRPSYIRASKAFAALIAQHNAALTDFFRDPAETVILLRDRKPKGRDGRGRVQAPLLDYRTTAETQRMSVELRGINDWLASADIAYQTNGERVDQVNDRALRRIFNNGSFEQGGRLTGGFWQQATMSPKEGRAWRGNIRIEGEPVVVIDFSSALLRLLYAEVGVQPELGDLYLGIAGLDYEHGPAGTVRDGVKQVISAMMFREGDLQKFPRGTRFKFPKGWGGASLGKAIKKRHPAIASQLGTSIGFRLLWRESEVLLDALGRCREQGVIALPVHDAIIVKESSAVAAGQIMLEAFKAKSGFDGAVGEPKRPALRSAELETLADTTGELPNDRELEEKLQWIEQEFGREQAALLVSYDDQQIRSTSQQEEDDGLF